MFRAFKDPKTKQARFELAIISDEGLYDEAGDLLGEAYTTRIICNRKAEVLKVELHPTPASSNAEYTQEDMESEGLLCDDEEGVEVAGIPF